MKIDRDDLFRTLSVCKRALRPKADPPVLGCFGFCNDRVMAHDGALLISMPSPVGDFVGAVPGAALLQWVKSQDAQSIEVKPDSKQSHVLFKAGRRRLTLSALGQSNLPVQELPESDAHIEVDDLLLGYLTAAKSCMGKDQDHPWAQGITLECVSSEEIRLWSTDNLTACSVSVPYEVPDEHIGESFVLIPELVDAVLANKDAPSRLALGSGWCQVQYEHGLVIAGRLVANADPQRFRTIFDQHDWNSGFAEITKSVDAMVAEAAGLSKAADICRAHLAVHDGTLEMRVDDGVVRFEGEADFGHEEIEVDADPRDIGRLFEFLEELQLSENALLGKGPSLRVIASALK